MKKILSLLLAALMVVSLLPTVAFATTPSFAASGSGSEDDPYIIMTLEQLNAFADAVNSDSNYSNKNLSPITGKYFKLGADIGSSGSEFTKIIGTSSKPFCGYFDGDGHTILLKINETGKDDVGLFGKVGIPSVRGSVHSLIVKGSVTLSNMSSSCYLGGLAGDINNATCYDCRSECNVTATSAGCFVGGRLFLYSSG